MNMWELILIAKKTREVKGERPISYDDKITFNFDSVTNMEKFLILALQNTTDKLELSVKYLGSKEGEE